MLPSRAQLSSPLVTYLCFSLTPALYSPHSGTPCQSPSPVSTLNKIGVAFLFGDGQFPLLMGTQILTSSRSFIPTCFWIALGPISPIGKQFLKLKKNYPFFPGSCLPDQGRPFHLYTSKDKVMALGSWETFLVTLVPVIYLSEL